MDMVRNEQMEEMLVCAVLSVWNVSHSFNPLTSTVLSFSQCIPTHSLISLLQGGLS